MRNPKRVTDLKSDTGDKNAGVRLMSNWRAIQLYVLAETDWLAVFTLPLSRPGRLATRTVSHLTCQEGLGSKSPPIYLFLLILALFLHHHVRLTHSSCSHENQNTLFGALKHTNGVFWGIVSHFRLSTTITFWGIFISTGSQPTLTENAVQFNATSNTHIRCVSHRRKWLNENMRGQA